MEGKNSNLPMDLGGSPRRWPPSRGPYCVAANLIAAWTLWAGHKANLPRCGAGLKSIEGPLLKLAAYCAILRPGLFALAAVGRAAAFARAASVPTRSTRDAYRIAPAGLGSIRHDARHATGPLHPGRSIGRRTAARAARRGSLHVGASSVPKDAGANTLVTGEPTHG